MARTLSSAQIKDGLRRAGFPEEVIPTMYAVTMAESGGNPYAHNPRGRDNSYGLTQINMLGDMGPERRQWFGLSSDDQLFDPDTNFAAAKKVYDAQGLGAWGAYTNGSYKKFLGQDYGGGQPVQARDAGPNAGGATLPVATAPATPQRSVAQDMGAAIAGARKEEGGERMAGSLGDSLFAAVVQQPVARMAGDSASPPATRTGGGSTFVTADTGASTGPHLDFRVWSKSKGGYVSNPGDYTHLVTTGDGVAVDRAFQMTSPYGMRNHPTKGGMKLHEGVDYATPSGTRLNVAGNFVDRLSEPDGGGNYNIYQHPTDPDLELVLMHGA